MLLLIHPLTCYAEPVASLPCRRLSESSPSGQKIRPNPIGVTALPLVFVTDESVVVLGLDAIDGTPVLNIKPYYPVYDKACQAVVPEWVTRLMDCYF